MLALVLVLVLVPFLVLVLVQVQHSGTGSGSNSGAPGSTFGKSTNFGPNESLSHDSHSQNPSIESIESTQISSTTESLKTKNERPKTPISKEIYNHLGCSNI